MRFALALLLLAASAFAQAPSRPFPQHTRYAEGVILPRGERTKIDAEVARLYDEWKARYLHAGCAPGQRYVAYNREKVADNRDAISCSEGHGYGMLLVALMAGHDPDARREFDELNAWRHAHPSRFDRELMAWQQVTGCVDARDSNDSATDGDLDIALALLIADAQWPDAHFRHEALRVIAAIRKFEINAATPSILLGDWVHEAIKNVNDTRLSDVMPGHFRAFAAATKDELWTALIDRTLAAVEHLQTSCATGLVPDFARQMETGKPVPAPPKFLESKHDGHFGYNSCRVPWRLGADFVLSGDPRTRAALERFNAFIEKAAAGDPQKIRAGYRIDTGKPLDKDDSSLAFTAPFAVAAMTGRQAWLDKLWAHLVAASTDESDYFGNSIRVLSALVISGNWWTP